MRSEDVLRTVTTPTTVALPRISGSRFVGRVAPAASEQAAPAVVDAALAAHDATVVDAQYGRRSRGS